MKRFGWVAVLGLVAASFAACGDDDGDDAASASASASGAEAAEPESGSEDEGGGGDAQAEVDAAVAAFAADLEAQGFTVEPETGEDEEPFEFTSEECQAFDDAFPDDDEELPGQVAEAETGSYQRTGADPTQGGAFVQGSAAAVEDDGALDEVFELLASDQLATCMREAMQQGIDESAAADPSAPAPEVTLDVERGDPVAGVDDGVALTMTGSMGVAGFSFDLDGVLHFVRQGDRVAMLLVLGFGAPHELDVDGLVETLLS